MWKRLLLTTLVSAALTGPVLAADMTVGFSQVGSESGWRSAETNVAKSEAKKTRNHPENRRRTAETRESDQGSTFVYRSGR